MMIIGLGNPGKEYENTFHNLGFNAIDVFAERLGKKIKKAECSALTCVFSLNGDKIVLAKPQTYMNLSGTAVKSLLKKYKMTETDLIVLYDDFDIPRHTLRARLFGSAGTHNGMKSIVNELDTLSVKRIRLGIGNEERDKKDYVLSDISKADREKYNALFDTLADALSVFLKEGHTDEAFEKLMRTLNAG